MKIRHNELKHASTKAEKVLLAFLDKKAKEIDYGNINIEFKIQNGNIVFFRAIREEETISFPPHNE
jgi:hypothetical protein